MVATPAVALYEVGSAVRRSGSYVLASPGPGLTTTASLPAIAGKAYDYRVHAQDTAGAFGDYCKGTFAVPKTNVVHGKAAGERLVGWAGLDRLFGGGGNDRLRGLAGNDYLFGNAGNDTLWGGAGKDHLDGGAGNDTIHAEDDHKAFDNVNCGKGKDTVFYNKGDVVAKSCEKKRLRK